MRPAVVLLLLLAACGAPARAPSPGAVPDVPGFALERMYAVREPGGGVRVGGLDGAAPPGATIGAGGVSVSADADGRFTIAGLAEAPAVEVSLAGRTYSFTVRDPAAARAEAVRPSLGPAGSVPNDLLILGDGRGLVVRSGDNAITAFDLAAGIDETSTGVRLPAIDSPRHVEANPWFAAALDAAGRRVAVTAYAQRHAYVVDLATASVERTFEASAQVVLQAPFALSRAVDVDGDGNRESTVTRFVPRSPQGIAVSGDALLVGFAGLVESGADPVFLPGVLAIWSLSRPDDPPRYAVLPYQDPQEVRAIDGGKVLITCSGVVSPIGSEVTVLSDGGVVVWDVATATIAARHDFGRSAPSSALIAAGALWVSSQARARVTRLDLASGARTELVLNAEAVDSIFRLVALPGGLVAAPSYDTDRLHVIDARTGTLDPPPFYGPLQVGPGRPVFDGLQIVARRPGRAGIDFTGPDLYAISGVAARITPIELRRILGP